MVCHTYVCVALSNAQGGINIKMLPVFYEAFASDTSSSTWGRAAKRSISCARHLVVSVGPWLGRFHVGCSFDTTEWVVRRFPTGHNAFRVASRFVGFLEPCNTFWQTTVALASMPAIIAAPKRDCIAPALGTS